MTSYREIVTKTVIGKGKKKTIENYDMDNNLNIDNILGCWVINHSFNGNVINNRIEIYGSYDINIWYSYDNNTKTNVMIKRFDYKDNMNIRLKNNSSLNNDSEIIVKCLKMPSVIDVNTDSNKIILTLEKEMGVEVIGDEVVRVSVTDNYDDYEEVDDIDYDINDDYLK